MKTDGTLLLHHSDIAQLLSLEECISAVEKIFRLQGEGKVPASQILGVHASHGGLHVKAGLLPGSKSYVVAKANTNFPGNGRQFGLPTIQGIIIIFDAENGCPRAILDSADVTIKRTAAASAVAAKYLARPNSSVATICGCGRQGRAHLRALRGVLPLEEIYAFDLDERAMQNLATKLAIRHVEHDSILDLCPVSIVWQEDKLRVSIDEFFDEPWAGNSIHFNFLAGDPFHVL